MLWNLVYDFFIIHVFGGYASTGLSYANYFGRAFSGDNLEVTDVFLELGFIDLYNNPDKTTICLGNYLSLIATIITMVIIVTLCALFIWKIIKLVGGLLR